MQETSYSSNKQFLRLENLRELEQAHTSQLLEMKHIAQTEA